MSDERYWATPAAYEWDRPDWFALAACGPGTAHLFFEPLGERADARETRVRPALIFSACLVGAAIAIAVVVHLAVVGAL